MRSTEPFRLMFERHLDLTRGSSCSLLDFTGYIRVSLCSAARGTRHRCHKFYGQRSTARVALVPLEGGYSNGGNEGLR